jgi:hypothetical protein
VDVLPAPFSLAQQWVGIFSIVGFPWLHHIPSFADFAMETMVCTLEVNAIPAPFNNVLKETT